MTVRLTFLCATAGDAAGDAVLGDGAPSERGPQGAGASGAALPPYSLAVRAPSPRCAQTADALGLETTAEPALRDFDYGRWRGRTVDDVVAADPHGFATWITDPDAAPHGGETVRQLCHRTANWLSSMPPDTGRALAITGPAVIRASLVHALPAPARAFWYLDVPPLSALFLTRSDGGWNVRIGLVTPRRGRRQAAERDDGGQQPPHATEAGRRRTPLSCR